MMKSLYIALALNCGVIAAQTLPAGTREADDTSRAKAASSRLQAAETALEKNDFATAIPLLNALTVERPKDAQIAYDLGYAEERSGDEAGATRAYSQAADLAPTMAEPKLALGLMDARGGRAEKAHGELQAAATLDSAPPELRGRAFRALAALDEKAHPETARDELLEAVKLTGETPEDIALSARLATHAGDSADAELAYRRTIATDPGNAAAVSSLAVLLAKEGKNDEAETLLEGALKGHANDPQIVSQLAAVYGQSGKTAEGIALLTQARAADPQFAANPAATRMLARIESLAGQDADSAQLYARLVSKDAQDPMLLDEYGGQLVKLQRFPEAQVVFTKALLNRSSFPTPQDWAETESHLAFAASRNHDPKLALQALAQRATVLPNSPSSLFLQAISYDALHQNGEAVKAYRSFLAVANGKYPDQEFQARHRLVAFEHTK